MARMQGSMSKFEVEPFDGKSNFSLWQSNIKDILVQHGLAKALNGKERKPEKMSDEEWEEMEMKAVSTIRLCLAPEVKYNVLNETSAIDLWKKLENMYMSKSLTNHLFLKKELYQLKMDVGADIRDHVNHFTKLITQLSGIGVKIDDEDKAMLLLSSLPNNYDSLITTLLVGKDTLKVDDVIIVLLENEKLKRSNGQSEESALVTRTSSGRSMSRDGNFGRDNSRSSTSRPNYKDKQCYYCHEMGHIKPYCRKLKADIEEFERSKGKGKEKFEDATAAVEEYSNYETDVLMVEEEKNVNSDCWFLDSGCSSHVCCKKEWFDTYDACSDGVVRLANDDCFDIVGKGTVKIKMHNGCVRTLGDVRYVPTLGRNLISLGRLDALGYEYFAKDGVLQVSQGSSKIMEGKKTGGNLYKLMGVTMLKEKITFDRTLIKPSDSCH